MRVSKADKTTLEGSVVERFAISGKQFMELPVIGAVVKIENDGSTQEAEIKSVAGSFLFENLTPGDVKMSITCQGPDENGNLVDTYVPFNETFPIVKGKNVMVVEMKKTSKVKEGEDGGVLDAAVAYADNPLVTFKNDTLVYNTDMVTFQNGDYAIQILNQLPGVEIQGKNIKVIGENVERTYVNGALIFGWNPMDAMDYLKADNVASIESYTEENPQDILSGHRTGKKQRVLNIKTHEPIVSVADIQLTSRGGFDGAADDTGHYQLRYLTGFYGRFFSEMRQIRTDVAIDNLGLGTSFRGNVPEYISSYAENATVKIGYEQYWNNRLFGDGLDLSYSYDHGWTKDRDRALTERYEMNGIPAQEEDITNCSSSRVNRHSFRSAYVLNTSPKIRFRWENNINVSDNTSKRLRQGYTAVLGQNPMMTDQSIRNETATWNVSENISLSRLKGRFNPTFNVLLTAGHTDIDSWDVDTLSSSYLKRYLTKDASDIPVDVNASVTHVIYSQNNPTRLVMSLFGVVESGYSRRRSIQQAYDMYGVTSPVVNAANTYDYTSSVLTNSGKVRYTIFPKNYTLTGDIALVSNRVIDLGKSPASDVDKSFWSIVPSVTFIPTSREKSAKRSISINYSATPIIPSVEQLRGRINDSKPLFLIVGNSNIRKGMAHSLSFSYSKYSMSNINSGSINASANLLVQTNPIVNRLVYMRENTVLPEYDNYLVPAGASLSISENTGASYSASTTLQHSRVLNLFNSKFKPTIIITQSNSFTDKSQYFGDKLDRTHEFSPSLNLSSVYTINQSIRYQFGTETSYTHVWNSSDVFVRNIKNSTYLILNTTIAKVLKSELGYRVTSYSYIKSDYFGNTVQRLWASVGVDLLKQKLGISLSGHDLLNGGSLYNVVAGPSSVTQSWKPVYGRFFLLSLTYRFNSSGGTKIFSSISI